MLPQLKNNQKLIIYLLIGIILVGIGVLSYKTKGFATSNNVEVLNSTTEGQDTNSSIVVEIAGAVEKPGVYKLSNGSRIDDLLISAGGISSDANREWAEKNINRASKLIDGQKVYIYSVEETNYQKSSGTAKSGNPIKSDQGVLGESLTNLVNINIATLSELDALPGIGQVYGQKIIEHRPYSNIEELVSKDIIPKNTFEKIKNLISVY